MAFKSTRRSRRHRNPQQNEQEQKPQTPFFQKKEEPATANTFFQPKLTIGEPGDPYEQEADAVADAVVSGKGQKTDGLAGGQGIQRRADSDMEKDRMVQEKAIQMQEEEEPLQMQEEEELQMMGGEEEEVQMQEEEELQMMGGEEEEVQMQEEEEEVQMQEEEEEVQMQEEEEEPVQAKAKPGQQRQASPTLAQTLSARAGRGRGIDDQTRTKMESGIGYDFSQVNIHTDETAIQMNRELGAKAFTRGNDVYFNRDQYRPETTEGQHLLAHELTHVVQQGKADEALQGGSGKVQKQAAGPAAPATQATGMLDDLGGLIPDIGTPLCPIPSYCPSLYCSPYPTKALARSARSDMAPILLAGIAAKINPRVLPFWHTYLYGGSGPINVAGMFMNDFITSKTTAKASLFLYKAIVRAIISSPPTFPGGSNTVTLNIASLIRPEMNALNDPSHNDHMNFSVIGEVPGNLVGGIGANQTSHKIGARPSPFNDFRGVKGKVRVTRLPNGSLRIRPTLTYTVKDTIDFCPGDCGAPMERLATVPMSMFEASGISGDVPVYITFPSPALPPITTSPGTVAPPTADGKITARPRLRIRQAPNTTSSILGHYDKGTIVRLTCQVRGEAVFGNDVWYKISDGYISGKYVQIVSGHTQTC